MKLSLVIPAYNEEKIIAATVRESDRVLEAALGRGNYEIIVVNDGSTDSTGDILASLSCDFPALRPLGYPGNRGKGGAVKYGMLAAAGDYAVFTDSDLGYGAEVIPAIMDFARGGSGGYDGGMYDGGIYDVVIGSRRISADGYAGYTPLRKIMSEGYVLLLKAAARFKYSDSQCGIKCFTRDAARAVFEKCETGGFAFDLEALIIADKLGLRVGEMPVRVINHGESKVRPFRDAFRMLRDARKIRKRHAGRDN